VYNPKIILSKKRNLSNKETQNDSMLSRRYYLF